MHACRRPHSWTARWSLALPGLSRHPGGVQTPEPRHRTYPSQLRPFGRARARDPTTSTESSRAHRLTDIAARVRHHLAILASYMQDTAWICIGCPKLAALSISACLLAYGFAYDVRVGYRARHGWQLPKHCVVVVVSRYVLTHLYAYVIICIYVYSMRCVAARFRGGSCCLAP
jgi:hypothetical protein